MNQTTRVFEFLEIRPTPLAVIVLGVLLASTTGAQAVHVIDGLNGAGSDFVAIQSAIDSAADGDLLLIRAGNYAEQLVLDGKGLTLQAEADSDVMVTTITVRNLGPSQFTSIRGLDVTGDFQVLPVHFADNRGSVWLEDLQYRDAGTIQADTVVTIDRCDSIVLRGILLDSRSGLSFNRNASIAAQESEVAIYGCVILGADALFEGHPGVSVSDSKVTIYGSQVTGGDGFVGALGPGIGGSSHPRLGLILHPTLGARIRTGQSHRSRDSYAGARTQHRVLIPSDKLGTGRKRLYEFGHPPEELHSAGY